jgi:hypothetical protein
MVVVTRYHHDLAPGERPPELLEERSRDGKRITAGAVAELQHVPEQDKSLDILRRLDQRGPRQGTTQHVGTGNSPEMQV